MEPAHALLFPPVLKAGLLTRDGGFLVRRICQGLGVEPAAFARLTGRTTESVAKLFSSEGPSSPREENTIRVLREMIQLLSVLEAIGLSPDDIKAWMHTPLPTFEGKTPEELIANGKGQQLVTRLLAYASGNVAT